MTVPVWDYVFLGVDIPKTDVPPEALRLMSLQSILYVYMYHFCQIFFISLYNYKNASIGMHNLLYL